MLILSRTNDASYLHGATGADMNGKHLILALLVLMMLGANAWAYQGMKPGTGHYQGFMADLSQEQQGKIQKLTDAHHEQLFGLQKELNAKQAEMDALLAVAPPDRAAILKLVDDMNALQAKKNILNIEYRIDLTEITGKPLPMNSGKGHGPAAPCPGQMPGPGAPSSGTPQGPGVKPGSPRGS